MNKLSFFISDVERGRPFTAERAEELRKVQYSAALLRGTFIFFLLAVSLLGLNPKPALALSFSFKQQQFDVSQDVVDSWQGTETISTSNVLGQPVSDLKNLLMDSVGQAPTSQTLPLTFSHHLAPIYSYLEDLGKQINQEAQEPTLEIQDGRASKFIPPQTGIKLDSYQTALATLRALELNQPSLELTVYETDPKTSLTESNNLGINSLIAEGVSTFKGSPKNRRFNIAAGVEKFKGIIVPQGAEFSFNDNLGPVDGEHGFLPELVIKGNDTIPEFGGGLCQVSTTTFRAAMAAGLPITARRNHAYPVVYYSPQGTDATIYPGSSDLKFINNTPGAILIWPHEKDSNTLVFDFYGTNDGRKVTLEKPYVYDRMPDGSMKTTWTRDITLADGTEKTDVFKSVYQSPALFHHENLFVGTSGAPVPTVH